MTEKEITERIEMLEFHQRLLIQLIYNPKLEFYKLIVENGLSEKEIQKFFFICDELSIKLEKQKAEGFVNFDPLLNELTASLPAKVDVRKVVHACLSQRLYEPLFQELGKYI